MRILLCALLLFVLAPPVRIDAQTLSGEVRWSGQRQVREKVLIPKGATLTIASGSRIEFHDGGLEVLGTLVAENVRFSGENWPGIVLTRVDQGTRLRGSRISGAQTAILVAGGSPRLEQLVLENNQVGIELKQQSRALVRDCLFQGNAKVGLFVKDGSAALVTENRFVSNGLYGAYVYRAIPEAFSGNRFERNGTGLMIAYFGSDPLIEGNAFIDNQIGIHTDRSAKPVLQGNRLLNNLVGIRLQRRSDALVRGNLLQNNRQGILVVFSSYPQIAGNDFLGNAMAVSLEHQSADWERANGAAIRGQEVSGRGAFGSKPKREVSEEQRRPKDLDGTVDARGNWWGQAELSELQQTGSAGNLSFIHDGYDQTTFSQEGKDYPLDRVIYYPAATLSQFSEGR